jgi:hypothetical protein
MEMPRKGLAMERLAKIEQDELKRRMRVAFERTMEQVAQAVNDARDGHLINDSEERCRDVLGEFRRLAYETAAQMRVEASEADPAFSPSAAGQPRPGEPLDPELQRPGAVASASLPEPRRRHERHAGG